MTDAQLKQAEFAELMSGDIVGQSGIERSYNRLLMGEDGARRVVVNSVGREVETISEQSPRKGQQLQLTIDYDLQRPQRTRSSWPGTSELQSCSTQELAQYARWSAYRRTIRTPLRSASIETRGLRSIPTH